MFITVSNNKKSNRSNIKIYHFKISDVVEDSYVLKMQKNKYKSKSLNPGAKEEKLSAAGGGSKSMNEKSAKTKLIDKMPRITTHRHASDGKKELDCMVQLPTQDKCQV